MAQLRYGMTEIISRCRNLRRETLTLLHVNNKGADQPTNPCYLAISTFVIHFSKRMISTLAACEILIFYDLFSKLVSVTEHTGLSITWSYTPNRRQIFSHRGSFVSSEILLFINIVPN